MTKTARTGASSEESLRAWNKILGLWRACDKAACRRACACRGNVRACMPVNFAKVPEHVQGWLYCLVVAQEEGLSFDEAITEIEKTPAAEAFRAWHEGDVTA
jgi:hypothetical protein